jgi:hypothetical protein
MTLLDAQEINPEKDRRKKKRVVLVIALILAVFVVGMLGALLGFGWWFRYWPERHLTGKFFEALQHQDYKTAYGIWMHDPTWEQHPKEHAKYPFNEFYTDWGPGGEWGLIKTEKVYGVSTCSGPGTGVVVDVIVNDRSKHAQVWVETTDKTLSFPPCELIFR